MSVLKTLTENVVKRNLQREGQALINKWEKTGLLEGLGNDYIKNSMAVLLENQAKELLREATTMASGDVDGYAAVAFPIVRRVFGGLLANQLVSVQPMSLPSGLVFFLDFTKGGNRDGVATDGTSIFGGGTSGAGIMTGVDVDSNEDGFYNLRQGLTSARGGISPAAPMIKRVGADIPLDGDLSEAQQQALSFDADLCATDTGGQVATVVRIDIGEESAHDPSTDARVASTQTLSSVDAAAAGVTQVAASDMNRMMRLGLSHLDLTAVGGSALSGHADFGDDARVVRRLTRIVDSSGNAATRDTFAQHAAAGDLLEMVVVSSAGVLTTNTLGGNDEASAAAEINFAISDNLQSASSGALGALEGAAQWQFEDNSLGVDAGGIPEIDIQVDSAAITAATRKLKARWTPELAQDLNAYHNLDAEVELTGVLSEHISLEIDQEILGDLIRGATADTLYWSRNPGQFVNRSNGAALAAGTADFTGTVSEWYETLVETINDVSASIHRKTLRGGANFLVCGPEVANILEFTSGFRASVTHDDDKGTVGAVQTGSISKKFDLFVDPYFPRNVILVGRKGGSFLESGYVYAPYVPLQVTPTIFDPDDFTPRKAVMTRYGKKLVASDMYGLVLVRGLRG